MAQRRRIGLQWVVGTTAVGLLLWTGYLQLSRYELTGQLRTDHAALGLTSLQLAPSVTEAAAIVTEWRGDTTAESTNALNVARRVINERPLMVGRYVAAALLGLWWASLVSPMAALPVLVTVIVAVGAGAAGLASTGLLNRVLATSPGDVTFDSAFRLARLASMTYFSLLLLSGAAVSTIVIGAVRAGLAKRRPAPALGTSASAAPGPALNMHGLPPELVRFARLLGRENAEIFPDPERRRADTPLVDYNVAADEPFVAFRAADMIGLALSGGGIRSATFNLGLLQGLQRLDLLRLVDYVSTVSGGGYVGAFWSEWMARRRDSDPIFPESTDGRRIDSPQERHLREFSGFLAPRWGFFEVETWTAIVAVAAGLIPALAVGLSVIGVALLAWLTLTFAVASPHPGATATVHALVTALTLVSFERAWRVFKQHQSTMPTPQRHSEGDRGNASRYALIAVFVVVVAAVLQVFASSAFEWVTMPGQQWPVWIYADGWQLLAPVDGRDGLARWWTVTGITPANLPSHPWIVSPRLFDFGLVWMATSLLLSVFRVALTARRDRLADYDRVLMRVMALGVAWIGIALVWHLAINVRGFVALAGAALSAGAFAALRNWIGTALNRGKDTSIAGRLKPYLPQILAYVAIVLSAVVVAGLLIAVCRDDWSSWWFAAVGMMVWLVAALFIEPTAFGLHMFYRERISRAYAGACNMATPDARANRATEPQAGDDRELSALRGRPLHLVCCAANDLQGDSVGTLGRGARSAVLSKHGFAMGTHVGDWYQPVPTLGAAVTASAAAFNSNMGNVSMQVGPAVSFLMTMLNLRLGLWLRHPAADPAEARRWPGLLLYREMFGWTSASGYIAPDKPVAPLQRDVHLSDGGHFENLALYELVRRHCRYIVMSDCAADPTAAFSDLGNALRRIREDFGVDISLDVSPLRAGADGHARQYAAVGTIHYSDTDHGILVYIKPAVLGDEPTDVLQYQQRNPLFPQEGTGDQFYDEAQWESYRRLGQHAAEEVFAIVEDDGTGGRSADWVFAEAAQRWGPIPAGLEDKVLEMTTRFGELESELQQRPALAIFGELFPEMAAALPLRAPAGGVPPPPSDPAEAMAGELAFLLRATQLMEDVWTACKLDVWWNHPLNIGWINLFARWTTAPTFVFWWPVLAPMFTPGFRQFIQQRFPLREDGARPDRLETWTSTKGKVQEIGAELPADGLAMRWWRDRATQPIRKRSSTVAGVKRIVFANMLDLDDRRGTAASRVVLQSGLAVVTFAGSRAGWTSDDFFVPPSLWGAGIGWHFLNGLLTELAGREVTRCYVVVPPLNDRPSHQPARANGRQSHQSARQDRLMFIDQYRKVGFREHRAAPAHPLPDDDVAMCHALECEPSGSTVLVLDVQQWARQRKP